MVVIVDYGLGNLLSILNMLKELGVKAIISSKQEEINDSTKLILPGVGSFDYGMNKINEIGLKNILDKKVLIDRVPVLGICLGAQIMTARSEEGKMEGLGWFSAETVKFKFSGNDDSLKIPHMGWRDIKVEKRSNLLLNLPEEPRFYFVHSYHFKSHQTEDVLASAEYGYKFAVALEKNNIIGVQFHPEKSHKFGKTVLNNFINNY